MSCTHTDMAGEEIELRYFYSPQVTASKEEKTNLMSGSHAHAGQTHEGTTCGSHSHARTTSTISHSTVGNWRSPGGTHLDLSGQFVNATRDVTALREFNVSGSRWENVGHAVLSSQHGTMDATHRTQTVTRAAQSPQHGTMDAAHSAQAVTQVAAIGLGTVFNATDFFNTNSLFPVAINAKTLSRPHTGFTDVKPHGDASGDVQPRQLVAFNIPDIRSGQLNSTGASNRCEHLQLGSSRVRESLQGGADNGALVGDKRVSQHRDVHRNVNYSNHKKGSKRKLTLKHKVDSFKASASSAVHDESNCATDRNIRRQLSSTFPFPPELDRGAHNTAASVSDTSPTTDSGEDEESKTSPSSEEGGSDETEGKTSPSSEEVGSDETEGKTSSSNEEDSDETESRTSPSSEEGSDEAEGRTSPSSEEFTEETEGRTSPSSEEGSDETEGKDSPDNEGKKGSSSSSSSEEGRKKKPRKKVKKRDGIFAKMMKSSPEEYWLLKVVLWFPVGIGMSVALYFLVIQKMNLQQKYKLVAGCSLGALLSLTFAMSVQMRCAMTLVVPTFVGKAGRSYLAAFAIVYLVNGPITNIMDNCKVSGVFVANKIQRL